jgi:secondary thiamine-phosphate synthase enzyme
MTPLPIANSEQPIAIHHRWSVPLAAVFGHADITPELETMVRESGVRTGVLTVQMLGSTGAITTIEYESGALSDLRQALDLLAPVDAEYAHNARWGDGNGFSHVRSALLKTSLSLPIVDGELMLGTWQQVVAINLDNRDRERELVAVLIGM